MFYPCASNLSCGDFPEKNVCRRNQKNDARRSFVKKQSKVLIKQPEVFFDKSTFEKYAHLAAHSSFAFLRFHRDWVYNI